MHEPLILSLSDNNWLEVNSEKKEINNFIKAIANKSLNELHEKNPHLLIFPDSFNATVKNLDKEKILKWDGQKLYAGNIMGFIGKGEVKLHIRSRFDKDDRQYFLHYLLSKVTGVHLVDLKNAAGKDDVFSFLMYLIFFTYLNKALRQGLFKKYVRRHYNEPHVKGVIDVAAHIRQNVPFTGKIAFTTREFSFDNPVMQLIRHTIEHIQQSKYFKFLSNRAEMWENIRLVKFNTPSYTRQHRWKVIQQNLKPVHHPYFTAYEPLRKLSLKILQEEGYAYGKSRDEVEGILFDGAWLWEEYLNTILKPLHFKHPENKNKKGGIYLFRTHERVYPDFYSRESKTVIDAKYKKLDDNKPNREDLYQLITYMHILCAEKGMLIYPVSNNNGKNDQRLGTLNGYGGDIWMYKFPVPAKAGDFNEFQDWMKKNEIGLREHIMQMRNEILKSY